MSSNLNALKFINTVFKDHAVLFFDYVGYGLSMSETCHPSTDMCYRSAWQAVKYLLVEKRLEREQLVIWGVGYGCTIASYLCSKLNSQCQALVLERPCPTRFATHVRGAWSKHLHNPVRLGAGVFGMAHELDMDRHLAEIHGHGQSYVKVLCLMTSKDEKQYFKGIHGHCPWAKCIIMDKYDRGSLFLIQAQLEQLLRVA
jgi:pimeloyl-ACP methyl ester carboxylesterase